MKDEFNNLEKSLMIPEKENIFKKIFNWVKNIFIKEEQNKCMEEPEVSQLQEITIPKAVKMPVKLDEPDENSLEYLYKLSDEELDDLESLYDSQMEDAKNEIIKLDNILEAYKQNIKKLQNQVGEESV